MSAGTNLTDKLTPVWTRPLTVPENVCHKYAIMASGGRTVCHDDDVELGKEPIDSYTLIWGKGKYLCYKLNIDIHIDRAFVSNKCWRMENEGFFVMSIEDAKKLTELALENNFELE